MSTFFFVLFLILIGGVLIFGMAVYAGKKSPWKRTESDSDIDAAYECHYCGEKNCECQRKDLDQGR